MCNLGYSFSYLLECCGISAIRNDFQEQPPHTLEIAVGVEAVIPCKPPRGKPDPKVRWKKDSDLVKYSDRIMLDESGTLRIQDAKKEDSGVYICAAYNVGGEKESMPCQLSVKGTAAKWSVVLRLILITPMLIDVFRLARGHA